MPTKPAGPAFARIGLAVSIAACWAAVSVLRAAPVRQQPTFRSAVDLIAVDVQVVDADGDPVGPLTPEQFEVSIEGHKRAVVSAEFIRHDAAPPGITPTVPGNPAESGTPQTGRTIVLAFDSGSFEVGHEQAPVEAIRSFLDRVNAEDRVGLFVFPLGFWIPPTTSRATVRASLDRILGQKEALHSHYNLRPWEIVDITAQSTSPNSFLTVGRNAATADDIAGELDPVLKVMKRECPEDPDCLLRIYAEGMELATEIEHQVDLSLGGIETLLRRLAEMPGRKSVVLVSAGLLTSDRLDARPDVGKMAQLMGQTAARANATVYTVHFDPISQSTSGSAKQRGAGSSQLSRDRALLGRWLDEFSAAAGGQRIYVPTGRGDFAFDRVLRESAAYYLLGVEPAEADRDGQPRQLKVKVDRSGVTVRSRQWVVVPRRLVQ
jgi:VWFA-related protein